jgi:hypothetical protein
VAAPKPISAGRRDPELQLAWQRVDTRSAPCLDLELVCGGTRSSGYRQGHFNTSVCGLLFSSPENAALKNLKSVLVLFEKVSGMKINFHKSEFIPLNLESEKVHVIAHVLNCPVGQLPFKYLGVPIYYEKLNREDLQPLLDKLIKRCAGWRGRLLVIVVG